MSALTLNGVRVSLGGAPILNGADLEFETGEIVLLAGRNGAGKTTLLRVAAGLIEPEAGHVLLGADAITALPRRSVAKRIALVPQDTAVPFPYTVNEMVLMGRAPHLGLLGFEGRADRALVGEVLARLGIGALAERSILDLSGGERQLVALARALAQQAPVLLLDEPTAHLDLARRLELQTLLRDLAAEGRTIVLVSHDLGPAAGVADRVALLAQGRILEVGPAETVLRPETLRATFGIDARLIVTEAGPAILADR
jgi:iron complex transport system ATP-binding protein